MSEDYGNIEIKLETFQLGDGGGAETTRGTKPAIRGVMGSCCGGDLAQGRGKKVTKVECCALPPMILAPKDVVAETRGTLFQIISALTIFFCIGLSVACLIVVTQNWNMCSTTWLNVFTLISMFLSILVGVVAIVLMKYFTLASKVFTLAVSMCVASWGAIGIWLLVRDSACLMETGRSLWIVSLIWTIVMFAPGVFMVSYCIFQVGGGALLDKGMIVGPMTKLFAGSIATTPSRLTVCLIGDSGTGKTTTLRHGWESRHTLARSAIPPKRLDDSESHFQFRVDNVTFIEVQSNKTPLPSLDLTGCDCVVMFISLADRRTFSNARKKWLVHARALCSVPLLVAGTHADQRRLLLREKMSRAASEAHETRTHAELLEPSSHPVYCISNMPPSILLRVMNLLTADGDFASASQVCRHWHRLSQHHFVQSKRPTAPVTQHEIASWMQEMKTNDSALNAIGFTGASGYIQVSPTDRSALKLLKKAKQLAADNDSKLLVMRGFDDRGRDTILFRKA